MRSSSRIMVRTSFNCGRFATRSGAEASSEAARIGSAAFFAPATRTSPASATPPCMESFCMDFGTGRAGTVREPSSARCPFFRRIGLHRQLVDLLAHAHAERFEYELVLAHARQPR